MSDTAISSPSADAARAGTSAAAGFDLSRHPCFSKEGRHQYARIHLPVAPRCNVQCNFCNRDYDCVNESRPGVTSTVLKPEPAVAYLRQMMARRPDIAVMGIAGPGDPFANPAETMETLRRARAECPELMLCIASNGLGIAPHVRELAALRVSHVTLTINAVDPEIGAKIYAWVRDGTRVLRSVEGARALLGQQMAALELLRDRGIIVKVNSVILPGINDAHIPEVARVVAGCGVTMMNCIPMLPVESAAFAGLPAPAAEMVARVRHEAAVYLPQMSHCARCRADAVGLLDEPMGHEEAVTLRRFAAHPHADPSRPYVAVATQEGVLVNQHLGAAAKLVIFAADASTESGARCVEMRRAPPLGGGAERWGQMAELLHDCRAVLAAAAGATPKRALEDRGIAVIEMEGLIEEGLRAVFEDRPVPPALQRRFTGCGAGTGCRGTGMGCS
jgi:nitrogen fixation protein NifB